ncbi:MAG: nitric-oxide reductase large subunit [Bdellovibrionota bacterium]
MERSYKKLWYSLIFVILASFSVLGYFGREIYRQAPPIPASVVDSSGNILFTGTDIREGQQVWQSTGGQELGSIWGHGAYVAPDWSADWLHREAVELLTIKAQEKYQKSLDQLSAPEQAYLEAELQDEVRKNTFDSEKNIISVSDDRARSMSVVAKHYQELFMNNPSKAELRDAYAMPEFVVKDPERMRKLNAFFFWTAWACVTERPNQKITYTNNWPPDKTVGNTPPPSLQIWTGFSVILLLFGIGLLAFYYASHKDEDEKVPQAEIPKSDPLLALNPTPSMRATLKYFWVVMALILVQVILGAVTAHYGVEGTAFYGFPLAKYLPYSVVRTWHLQLGIFWIATSWLATGLFIGPAVSGYEPKYQRLGVNFLFVALLIIVVGSMAGQWFAIMQRLSFDTNFWFGHQGFEYVDLGRFWQIFLVVGLFLWLFLMVRSIKPAFKNPKENKNLLALFLISCGAIALFYSAGLMWGKSTNLAISEYWRWWVVHLWVEGFFEVFATVVIAFLFVRMGLLRASIATATVLFSTTIFLSGGIIGTFHHLYFTGTPTAVIALGATFSGLEVVPLILIGFEAYHNLTLSRASAWLKAYKWPIYFFVAVAFWNFVGAGIFGFLINPPMALYYMQGLNTTPVHSHAALFGVYGMLGIGLMLFVLKGLAARNIWKDKTIRFAFWSLNIGLALMTVISILPVGLFQTWASVNHGYWYARSAEFQQQSILDVFRWLRILGDTVFTVGTLALGYFVLGLKTGASVESQSDIPPSH